MKANLPVRQPDSYGAGHYGASRGDRQHNGIDFACAADTEIYPLCSGEVTKVGYPYADDLSFRYVQISDSDGNDYRYFYLDPMVEVGDYVEETDVIGLVQDLTKRYPRDNSHANAIQNHIHFEVERDGENINPEPFAGL